MDRRFIALKEITVFSDEKLTLPKADVTIKAGELVKFTTDKYRNGKYVLFLAGKGAGYIHWEKSKVEVCKQVSVLEENLDIILVPLHLVDTFKTNVRFNVQAGNPKKGFDLKSSINRGSNGVAINLVNGEKGKVTISTYALPLSGIADDLQLVSLGNNQKVYLREKDIISDVNMLRLPDGRVAFSSFDSSMVYSVDPAHETVVNILVLIVTLLITIGSVIFVLAKTGYILFATIAFFVVGVITYFIVGFPLLALINFVRRRI